MKAIDPNEATPKAAAIVSAAIVHLWFVAIASVPRPALPG